MIPAIGLMIAAYIFTRMAEMLAKPTDQAPGVVKFFAVVTMIITGFMALSLIGSGLEVSNMSRNLGN